MDPDKPLPRALLDANVLWSPVLRDTLLRAAENELYLPLWTTEILGELTRTILAKRPNVRGASLARMIANMQDTFPGSTVEGHAPLIPAMTNHPGDRHVLAAAILGRAESIVTWNRRHFLPAAERQFGVAVVTPDTFLCQLWEDHPSILRTILIAQGAALRPPSALAVVLDALRRSSLHRFVDLVSDQTALS